MTKTPLQRLDQYQVGLAIAAVASIGIGFALTGSIATLAVMLFCLGGVLTLALLISWSISYAAQAIIEAVKNSDVVD